MQTSSARSNSITYTVTVFRGIVIRGTAQRQTFENLHQAIEVNCFLETANKGFIDALLLSQSLWSTKSDMTFVETKNPHRTFSVKIVRKPLKRERRATAS